ncbi:hypothetical protein GCM10017044_21620 [Kordiimonas sediminis]|uniref:Sulfotransferase family protein n=1 Tax=Kordiimonas sediminis TaxID=1735581 RepID=A0A919AVZ2_9PROT|nr:hypothetical protein [Kordiimonas sediminis]GHF26360.1 hypothetical protein GCM10017044_21620 [Kordiimonas sediminis]
MAAKFKQCYLHIGATKTGTSSIQDSCFANRAILAEKGYFYPSQSANHGFMASAFRTHPEKMWMHKAAGRKSIEEITAFNTEMMEKFENEVADTTAHTLLISSEFFPSTDKEKIPELYRYLNSLSDDVKVVYYVRHPISHAVSSFQQGIKTGMDTFKDRRSFKFYAPGVLKKFAAVFGKDNMIVREFDRDTLYRSDSVFDFCQIIGLADDIADQIKIPDSNQSLSYEAVLLSNARNVLYPVLKDGVPNPERALSADFSDIPGVKFMGSYMDGLMMDDTMREGLDYIRSEYGLPLSDPSLDAAGTAGETANVWSDETLEAVVRRLNETELAVQYWQAKALTLEAELALSSRQPKKAANKARRALQLWPGYEPAAVILSSIT